VISLPVFSFNNFEAPLYILVAIIFVLSNMSFPGPNAIHLSFLSGHWDVFSSQGKPVFMHLGPAIFGETSPKFADETAPTNSPLPTRSLKFFRS
jgi:hypothetical protein